MAQFDPNKYFASRATAAQEKAPESFGSLTLEKIGSIQNTAEAKKIELLGKFAQYRQTQEEANAESWIGEMGLDPEGIVGGTANLVARGARGVGILEGMVAGAYHTARANALDQHIPDEVKAARKRQLEGVASPEDLALLNLPEGDVKPSSYQSPVVRSHAKGARTNLERIQAMEDQVAAGKSARQFWDKDSWLNEGIAHKGASEGLMAGFTGTGQDVEANFQQAQQDFTQGKYLSSGGELVAGIAKGIAGLGGTLLTNKQAAVEQLMEQLPQFIPGIVAGAPGMAASAATYAMDEFGKGIAEYQKKHGQLPPQEEVDRMALTAASLAAAEFLGEKVTLGAGKLNKTLAREALQASAEATARKSFKAQLLGNLANNMVTRTGLAGLEGAAGEFATEAYQTYGENAIQGKDTSITDMYVGGALGATAGGGISAGMRGMAELTQATPEHAEERAKQTTRAEQFDAAVEAGDPSAYLDPKTKTYDPAKAVQVLFANAQQETATPEIREANLKQAGEIVNTLEKEREDVARELELTTPAGRQKQLDGYRQQLATATPADAETLQQLIALTEEDLAAVTAQEADPAGQKQLAAERKAIEQRIAKMDERLATTRNRFDQMGREFQRQDQTAEVESQVEAANVEVASATPETVSAAQVAADRVITLSMAAPEALTHQQATALADNTANGLTAAQRSYLRQFSAARLAENTLKDMGRVSQEIYYGSKKNLGIAQYRERMAQAIARNDKLDARRQLTLLKKFAKDHAAKYATAQQALSEQGRGAQIAKAKDGSWQVLAPKARMSRKALRENGGVELLSEKLVADIGEEARALGIAAAELQALGTVKFTAAQSSQSTAATAQVTAVEGAQERRQTPAVEVQNQSTVDTTSTGSAVQGTTAQVVAPVAAEQQSEVAAPNSAEQAPSTPEAEERASAVAPADAEPAIEAELSVEEIAEEAITPAIETGTLEALSQPHRGTDYKQRNLIAAFFAQTANREGDATQRPLVAVKNFLSQWIARAVSQATFTKVEEPTDPQIKLLRAFREKAQAWQQHFRANLVQIKNPDYRFNDLMQFFIQARSENGKTVLDLDENLMTAMSYAAFSWIAENASRSPFNTDEEINLILGRDEEATVAPEEKKALLNVGTRQNVVVNALGQRAVQALGLQVKPDAPVNVQAQLEAVVGAHILKMLMDAKLLARETVSGATMAKLTGNPATNTSAGFQFVKLARNGEGVLATEAEAIYQAAKGTQGLLDKLFSVEPALKEPSLTPIPFNQKTTKNTRQRVPKKLAEIIEAKNAEANYLRQDMWNLLGQLGEDVVLAAAGVQEVSETATHAAKRDALKAKNDGLKREYARLMDYVRGTLEQPDVGLDHPIYFEHTVWKQQRVGIATNAVNPQTSKLHRFMLFRKSWETQVSLDDAAQMDHFFLRVAEGLGVKTDKQSSEKALAAFHAKFDTHATDDKAVVLNRAVAVLRKAIYESSGLTADEQQAVLAGVKTGGEKFHSLDALVAMAHYEQAKASGQTQFTVQMMGEIDGVTNGPMLSHLLMGAANTPAKLLELLNRGGFYEEGHAFRQYNLWRGTPGHLDLYETTSRNMTQAVQRLEQQDKVDGQILQAIYAFTGELVDKAGQVTKEGRNIIKTPLTAMVFGSAMVKAVDSMADNFIEDIYTKFEQVVAGKADRASVIANVNRLLGSPKLRVPGNTPAQALLTVEFSEAQIAALKRAFEQSLGEAVKLTMKEDFGAFIAQRNQINQAAALAFKLYDAAYAGLREQFLAEEVKAGAIAVDGKGNPIHDLTKAQEGALRKRIAQLAPVLHTLMSKDSGDLAAGLHMSKSARKLSERATFGQEVHFGRKFDDNGARSTSAHGYENVATEPGAAMAPMSVHSTDSAISHYAAALAEVLNVHDAHGAGLGIFNQTAKNLNAAVWNAMLNYSPVSETAAALERTIGGLSAFLAQDEVPAQVVRNLTRVLQDTAAETDGNWKTLLLDALQATREAAFHADDVKLAVLSQLGAIDQYALEGGNYEVTDADRAAAAAKRSELSGEIPATTMAALATIAEKLDAAVPSQPAVEPAVPSLDGNPVLTLPTAQVLQLLEHAINDETLSEAARERFAQVREAMWFKNLGIEAAARSVLSGLNASLVITHLASDYHKIPPHLWGERGSPAIQSDPDLVALFEQRGSLTAAQALQVLKTKLGQQSSKGLAEFNQRLLAVLAKTVDPELRIRYVTPATAPSLVLDRGASKARGWYVSKGAQEAIYVLSPEFVHSGLTPELLLHELLHAALARTIDQASKAQQGDAYALVQELETLREKAQAYAAEHGITDYAPALNDVQEFVAWGLSNLGFQKDVLAKLSMASKTQGNALVTGMKKFIDAVAKLLFKRPTEADTNGLSVLIANTSGLFYAAAQQKTPAELVLNQQGPSAIHQAQALTTTQLFEALAPQSNGLVSSFEAHLKGLLSGIVAKLHGPFGSFKATLEAHAALSPLDVFQKAMDTGVAPFASKILASPFPVTPQVAFVVEQVEATVRAALDGNESRTTVAYNELSALWAEAKERLSAKDFFTGDWAQATSTEQADAQARYDFVFKIEKANGDKSDYLSRFAALGLAHPQVNRLLQVPTKRDTRTLADMPTIADKVQLVFERILDFFHGKLTRTYDGQPADEKLVALVDQLVGIEAKKRRTVAAGRLAQLAAPIDDKARAISEAVRAKIGDIASSEFLRKNRFPLVRAASGVVVVVAKDRVEVTMEHLSKLRNQHFKGREDLLSGIISNVRGPLVAFRELLEGTKLNEKHRKFIITEAGKAALESFADEGKSLEAADKAAISAVFLRTDMASIVDDYGVDELEQLLTSPNVLSREIHALEQQLSKFKFAQHFYVKQAKLLGYYMATGTVRGAHVLMNARNIARLVGTPFMDRVSEQEAVRAEALIDRLVTLRALQYTGKTQKLKAARVMAVEAARQDGGNGVEMVLRLHKRLQAESKARLFKDSEALMMKGYTPEIYNPHTDIVVADDVQGKEYEALGYAKGAKVASDAADPNQADKHLYVMRDAGLDRRISGIVSLTGLHSKGSIKPDSQGFQHFIDWQAVTAAKQGEIRDLFKADVGFDPDKAKGAYLAPIVNPAGEVVDYRYLMQSQTKDALLERDNRFEKILGTMAGSIYDKETSPEQNRKAVQALRDQYQADYAKHPDDYVRIDMKSPDPALREIYRLLPAHTKQAIRDIWGEDGMMVRIDSLDIMFGYRKAGLAQVFEKNEADRNGVENLFVGLTEWALSNYAGTVNAKRRLRGQAELDAKQYAKRAALIVRRNERIWQEIVHEAKDIIVTKTGTVLVGNILSNLSLLMMNGVPLTDIWHHHRVAMKGALEYQKDNAERYQLQLKVDSGVLSSQAEAEARQQILRLEDALARNPVRELIDAGLMPTIVEDVAADDDIYSYKSQFARKMDRFTEKLHPGVLKAAKTVYMTHDTPLYKGLSHVTQLSDFVARYTLYQHLTTREKNPLTSQDAISSASDSFINYDVPMPRGLQYLDDMGIVMFTKYFLRIQRVLLKLTRENPARVLGHLMLHHFIDVMPMVTDSSFLARFGNNPLEWGALQYPATLDELATVNASLQLFK